jgi:photosystem II stability/assembly factor-like uncharacterized protein
MRRVMGKTRSTASRLPLWAILVAVLLCQSCVRDLEFPEEAPGAWVDVPSPPVLSMSAAVCVSDGSGTLYLGASPGVWRSSDRGETWTEGSVGLNAARAVRALVAKRGAPVFAALDGGGVFVSRDRGDHWIQVNNHLTDLDVLSLAAGPGGELIAGTENGAIFRSNDEGGVWTMVEGRPTGGSIDFLVTDSVGTVYAASRGRGVFFSTDGGLTWTPSAEGLDDLYVLYLALGADGSILTGGRGGSVYRAPGPGAPWTHIDKGATHAFIYAVAADEAGDIFAGTYNDGVIFTRDGGATWEKSKIGLGGLEINSLVCTGGVIVAATSGAGALRSTDGGRSWILPRKYRSIDPGRSSPFTSISVDSCGTYYVLKGSRLLRSRDGGRTWMRADGDQFGIINCLAIHPGSALLAGTIFGIFVSFDSGESWSRADTLGYPDDNQVMALDVAAGGMAFGYTSSGVLRSPDGCSSWGYALEQQSITCLCTGADSCVYIGTAGEGVLGSIDGGTTWRRLTDTRPIASISADRAGNVFVISESGYASAKILCSSDRGESWKTVHLGGGYLSYRAIAARGGEMALILDEEGTLYESEDCFSTWSTVQTPFLNGEMFLSPDGRLFINEAFRAGLHRSREPLFVPRLAFH